MKIKIEERKSYLVFWIIMVVMTVQFSSCTKEKKTKHTKLHTQPKEASDTIFDRESAYYIFIQKNNPKAIQQKVIFFKEKDIDLDGINEAIVALGNRNTGRVKNLYILKNDKGGIKQVVYDFNLDDSDHFTYDVKLITFQGQKPSYMCLTYGSGGLSIFELKDDTINPVIESTVYLCENDCFESLIDGNKEGVYEGYARKKEKDYDLGYSQETDFAFVNGVFKQNGTKDFLDPYPNDIKGVLLQYIRLRLLPGDDVVNYRLNELCTDTNASAIKWNKDWYNLGARSYYRQRKNDSDYFNIQEDDDTANAAVAYNYVDDNKMEHLNQLQFELEKFGNKWQITKVVLVN